MISILVHTISGDENRNQLEKATFRSNFEKWFLQSIPESPENVSTEDTNSKKKIEKFYTIAYSVKLTITSPTLELFPKQTFISRLSIFILLVLALYISFPAQLIRRAILLIFVFIIYPVAVLLIRKFWKFYHDRQKKDADDKIKALEKQKEEILETVMEKVSFLKINMVFIVNILNVLF